MSCMRRVSIRRPSDMARSAAAHFPEEAARTTYWKACLLALLGDEAQALEALEEGARRGLWWAPQMLEADPDLEALRTEDRFRAIVEAGRRAQASAAARPPKDLIVRPPASGKPRGALVALHARGQRADDMLEPWAAASDALLVAPHSTQPFDPRDGCWDDPQRADADVRWAVDRALADAADLPLVVGGFSQGAGLAVSLAARRRISGLVGCIALGPTASWARELIGPDIPSAGGLRFALLNRRIDTAWMTSTPLWLGCPRSRRAVISMRDPRRRLVSANPRARECPDPRSGG